MDAITIELTPDDTYQALRLALASFRRNQHQKGWYHGNKLEYHLAGKLGEYALEKWFEGLQIEPDPAYRHVTREAGPDLIVNGHGIEMKTWRTDIWLELGRCVRPGQIGDIQQRSVAVVWGILDDDADPFHVTLAGWSEPDEVRKAEVRRTGKKQLENHQLDLDQLLKMDKLLTLLQSGAVGTARSDP